MMIDGDNVYGYAKEIAPMFGFSSRRLRSLRQFGLPFAANITSKFAVQRFLSTRTPKKHRAAPVKYWAARIRYTLHRRRKIPALVRKAIFERDDYTCRYCGLLADTIDHERPIVRGGTNDPSNLFAAYLSCNSKKHDKTHREYIKCVTQ